MTANETQVGGTHYASVYQHWDWVINCGLGYLEGQATRYIVRWRKKDGLQDLQKALHYINKLIEVKPIYQKLRKVGDYSIVEVRLRYIFEEIQKFSQANRLTDCERAAIQELATWQDEIQLLVARDLVLALIKAAEPKPVPISDSNKHAERVKCLVSKGLAVDFAGNTIEDCRFPNCDCERVCDKDTLNEA